MADTRLFKLLKNPELSEENIKKYEKEVLEIKVSVSEGEIIKEKSLIKNKLIISSKEYNATILKSKEKIRDILGDYTLIENTMEDAIKELDEFEQYQVNEQLGIVSRYEEYLIEIRVKINDLETDSFYNSLKSELMDKKIKKEKERIKEKYNELQREIIVKNENKKFTQKEKKFYKDLKDERYQQRKAYNFFVRVSEELPAYMERNLKEMPNNKGYIFKGIYFYGLLPSEGSNKITMFENKSRDVLLIHEWTPTHYTVFEKNKNMPKRLISKEPRKKIYQNDNILNYVVKK